MSLDLLCAIERAAVRGWPALDQREIDGWIWRCASGGSIRANSVAALDWRGTDVERTIDACEALYRANGAPCVFTISDVSAPGDLDVRLGTRGYVRGDDHVTMAKVVSTGSTPQANCGSAAQPTEAWLRTYLSGLSPNRRGVARQLIANLPSTAKFVWYSTAGDAQQSVTSTGLTITDGALASIQCMATDPVSRRSGGAGRVLQHIERLAVADGATHLYLQTGADNVAARALYARFGFDDVGRYHTRTTRGD